MNFQMMVQVSQNSISPWNDDSITIDARVVNAPTTVTINTRYAEPTGLINRLAASKSSLVGEKTIT